MNESNVEIIDLTRDNLDKYPLGCLKGKKHVGYQAKLTWFNEMTKQGLCLKILLDNGKYAGFIEYVEGKNVWRGIEAENYLCIHCIWVYPKKYQKKGYAKLLLNEVIKQAENENLNGVTVITSKGSWLPDKRVFLEAGFKQCDGKDRFELLVYKLNNASDPKFKNVELKDYSGLNIVYSVQCPMNVKFIQDIEQVCEENNVDINFIELSTGKQAQNIANPFSIFTLIYNNEIFADNPISATRFKNILKKLKLIN